MGAKCLCNKCFCLPVRYGLLTWGYLIFLASCVALVGSSSLLIQAATVSAPEKCDCETVAFMVVPVILTLTNAILSCLFVIGCHKRNVNLIRLYYIYGICVLFSLILFGIYLLASTICGVQIKSDLSFKNKLVTYMYAYMDSITVFALTIFVIFILLLVRSELMRQETKNRPGHAENTS